MESLAEKQFGGFHNIVEIDKSSISWLFRAMDDHRNQRVLLKLICLEHLGLSARDQINEEILRLRSLKSKAVLDIYDHRALNLKGNAALLIIQEDFTGATLRAFLSRSPLFLSGSNDRFHLFCSIAIQMAQAVRDIHKLGMVHRGINPFNFYLDDGSRRVKLSGFAWEHSWMPEWHTPIGVNEAMNVLAYVAPEQTGRLNLSVDGRANLYSLGAVFYEILTGRPPFSARNSAEILYRHVAEKPIPPCFLNPAIPPCFSELTLKMLAKHPRDRYQSIAGLLHDLKEIKFRIDRGLDIHTIDIAQKDVSPLLKMPTTLYGRKQQIDLLRRCFDRVYAGDTGIVLVTGEGGVGKTELVRTLGSYVHEHGGNFFAQQFDRSARNRPGDMIKSILFDLVQWMLIQSPDDIRLWKRKIMAALSPNGQILIDLVPEFELIIGKQPPVSDMPPREASVRINLVVEKIGSLFIDKKHPLVLFLDDMQWADRETLEQILNFMLARKRPYMLILGAYRNDTVDTNSALTIFKDKMLRTGIPIETVHLMAFHAALTNQMVAGILSKSPRESLSLSKVVHRKTGGNPFFIWQFMNSLQSNGLIHYDLDQGGWTYDLKRVSTALVTDNVATLLSYKIENLPDPVREVLQAAACAGHHLDIPLLSVVLRRDRRELLRLLQTALDEGLLRDRAEDKTVDGKNGHHGHNDETEDDCCRLEFAHDQILQAIYRTLSEEKSRHLHWEIGQAMVRRGVAALKSKEVYEAVYHFGRGASFVDTQEKKTELARLTLMAGRNAMASAAFEPALAYLRSAMELLPEYSWQSEYELTFSIYCGLAKCEFVLARYDAAESLFNTLLDHAASLPNKLDVYNFMVVLHTAAGNIQKALCLGRQGLAILHIKPPRSPSKLRLLALLIKLRFQWGFKKFPAMAEIHNNPDEELNAVLKLLTNFGLPAFYVDPRLCLWLVATGAVIGIRDTGKGYPLETASFGLISLGALIGSVFGFIGMGRMYSKIGMHLQKRYPHTPYQVIGYFVTAFFNRHWYEPARKNMESLKRAYRLAIQVGDINYAGNSLFHMFMVRIFLGDNLDDIYAHRQRYESFLKATRSPIHDANYAAIARFYIDLKGGTGAAINFHGEMYDPERAYRENIETGNAVICFTLLLMRLKTHVFYQQWEEALNIETKINALDYLPVGSLILTEYYFYAYLAATGMLQEKGAPKRHKQCRRIIAAGMKRIKRWSRMQPANFAHMFYFMRAEKDKLAGRPEKTLRGYRRAIELSKAGGFTHIVAMICEHAGVFLQTLNDPIAARSYLTESRKYYSLWGAAAKAADMTQKYADLSAVAQASLLDYVDLKYVVETLQALSKEIVVGQVLRKLMGIILENTGANRAVFISNKQDELFVEMERRGGESKDLEAKGGPMRAHGDALMASVVYYVKRTRMPMAIDDAKTQIGYIQKVIKDPYAPKSILCLPLIRKDRLVGLLYLENTITSGVFTAERIEFIKMIASQAAISFENATLYEHVVKDQRDLKALSQKLRSLHSKLMMTEERERRRIATDLHDRIGHGLTAAKMALEQILNKPNADHVNQLKDTLAVIGQAINDARTLTFELSPPILYHFGLGAAIGWLCDETEEKHGLKVFFADNAADQAIDQKTSILCFQVFRELIINVIKHARANTIDVSLSFSADGVHLIVTDNGIGFDPARRLSAGQEKSTGFGLFSINERLNLSGGRMVIDSMPERGTTVSVTIPCGSQELDPEAVSAHNPVP
ncbi:MAG: AAA family ATPase [Desulfobacterales bacterium]|nr:AAA family ATPase [Desulfobacterales bacterium]